MNLPSLERRDPPGHGDTRQRTGLRAMLETLRDRRSALPASPGARVVWAMLGVAVLAALLYARAVTFGFWFDDAVPIISSVEGRPALPLLLPVSTYGYYRPVGLLIVKGLTAFGPGLSAPLLHGLLVLLHAANAALLWLLAYRLSGSRLTAWVSALAFAASPFGYEAVAYVAALFHPLIVFWTLLTVLLYRRARQTGQRTPLYAAHACVVLAVLSHENGVIIPLLLSLWEWQSGAHAGTPGCRIPDGAQGTALQDEGFGARHSERLRALWRSGLPAFFIVPLAYLLLWWLLLSSQPHDPRTLAGILNNALIALQALAYPLLPLLPMLAGRAWGLLALATLVLGGSYLTLRRSAQADLGVWALAWYALSAGPSVLLLSQSYMAHGPRLMYLASVGLALLWGLLIGRLAALLPAPHPAPTRAWLVRGAQFLLTGVLLLPPLPFVKCQLDLFAHTTRIVRGMSACARATPAERDLVLVNLPYYWTAQDLYPRGCPNPYPWYRMASVVIPNYSNAQAVVRDNGGPDRPVEPVRYAGYAPTWVTMGREVAASNLRAQLDAAQVYALDLPSATFVDLNRAWEAASEGQAAASDLIARFLAPLRAPPELASAAEVAAAPPAHVRYAASGPPDAALELVAYATSGNPDAESASVRPGQVLSLTLFWQALGAQRPNLTARVRLYDRYGNAFLEQAFVPVPGLPTATWDRSTVYATRLQLAVPAGAAQGLTPIEVVVWPEAAGAAEALAAQDQDGRALGSAPRVGSLVLGQVSAVAASDPAYPRQDLFADQVRLLGYDLGSRQLAAGGILTLVLYWRAERSLEHNYTVSVQLLSSNGQLVAQQDNEPNHGQFPTSAWAPGQIVRDEYSLVLPKTLAAGSYRLLVALYEWPSLQRLPVQSAGVAAGEAVVLEQLAAAR